MYTQSFECKTSTVEYALMRVMQYMNRLSLFEIGMGLTTMANTDTSEENVKKFLRKVEDHIKMTNERLLKNTNIHGVY